jgi:hypothetical protein
MELPRLHYFIAVAEELHYTRTPTARADRARMPADDLPRRRKEPRVRRAEMCPHLCRPRLTRAASTTQRAGRRGSPGHASG